jgi:hypothetical protein
MQNSNGHERFDTKLEIGFPKSDQDHRLQLVSINGSIFAIVYLPLESLGPIRLCCEEWSLILLAPIKSKTNVLVSAINVICLNEIESEEGHVNVHATNRLVKLGNMFKPAEKVCEMGERGEFQCDDDPGALLYYHRLFSSIVNNVHNRSPDSFADAQQNFISSLFTLADKIEGKPENLDLQKVFGIWDILYLKT